MKATWGLDYDWRNDKCYKAVIHDKCDAPIVKYDEKYVCAGCGKIAELDAEMKAWLDARSGTKVETEKCMKCGNKTMKIYYHKNNNTAEWEVGYGECENCKMRFIV